MFFGYIDRHLPHPAAPFRHDAVTTHAFTGVGDNQFKNENLSTVLHPGEAYVVGVYSSCDGSGVFLRPFLLGLAIGVAAAIAASVVIVLVEDRVWLRAARSVVK